MNKEKILELVRKMCKSELDESDIARELLNIANVPDEANIQEIPLSKCNQVEILFLLPNDNNYYSLFAGIGCDGNFYFELSICGILQNNIFDFYNEEIELDINYFVKCDVDNMKKFTTYEEPLKNKTFTENEMKEIYCDLVDKNEYQDFDCWNDDMLKSGVFEELK